MANTKISALTPGTPAQSTDVIPIDRAGANFSLTASDIIGGAAPANVVSAAGTLTANQLVIGAGTKTEAALGSLGTTTTVLHGNAAGAPSFGAVSLTTDVSGVLPVANGGTGQSQAGQYGVMIARLAASTTVTGTVTETVAFTGSIPASFLTTTSRVVVMLGGKVTTGVGAISLTIRFGAAGSGLTGTAIFATASLGTSGAFNFGGELTIINNGSLSAQNSWSIIRDGSGVLNNVNAPSSINTANASEVNIDFTVPTLNDVVALYDASVIVYP